MVIGSTRKWVIGLLITMTGVSGCGFQPRDNVVGVTRVVVQNVLPAEQVEVTRIVTETVIQTLSGEDPLADEGRESQPKELVVCQKNEPTSLYPYGEDTSPAATAVRHAVFESNFTNLSFGFQARGLEKLPSLTDGDAVVRPVVVAPGERVYAVDGRVVPWGEGVTVRDASGAEVAFDGNSVTLGQLAVDFQMKPRVWSDGTPVTADDSVFAFELLRAGAADAALAETAVRTASYEATGELGTRWLSVPGYTDDPTFFLNFFGPFPRHAWGALPVDALLQAEEVNRFPIGDGPFVVDEWVDGDAIRLKRNTHYYRADEGLPHLDVVTFRFMSGPNQLLSSLLSGECDVITQESVEIDEVPFLIEAEASGLLVPYFESGTVYEHIDFGINSYGPYADGRPDWFEDVRVRQAVVMCTDRQRMVADVMYGRSQIIHSYVPGTHPLYPAGQLTEWPYDVARANTLLDQVGFVDTDGDGVREYSAAGVAANNTEPPRWNGTPFEVRLGTAADNEVRQQIAEIFRANLADCGIAVEIVSYPADVWFGDGPASPLFGRTFDLGQFPWLVGVSPAWEPACQLFQSGSIIGPEEEGFGGWDASNVSGWTNEAFDAACAQALESLPGTPAYVESHRAAQLLFAEQVPIIPLFLRLKVAVARPQVLNFGIDATQPSELYNLYEIDVQQLPDMVR